MDYLIIIVGGLVGGALRGLMGIAKGLITKKEEKINYKYFLISLGVSAVVGLIAALMVPLDFKFAVLAGYAGSDFLETLYKMKLKAKFEEELEEKMEEEVKREEEEKRGSFKELIEKQKKK